MVRPSTGSVLTAAGKAGRASIALFTLLLLAACSLQAEQLTVRPSVSKPATRDTTARPTVSASTRASASEKATASPSPTERPTARAVPLGTADTFRVASRQLTLTEPAHTGPTGEALGPRTLITQLWYPRAVRSAGSAPASGPFPLLLFAPGFQQCADRYADLLTAWARAGYVVAAVNFPRTSCQVGAAAYEPDLVNQPGDVSYLLTRLLALSAKPGGPLSGLIDRHEVAAAGQSDGGDTVAALAANPCCTDRRLAAVAVLSGAEWPPMPGRYFADGAPPMLFVQGSADTINPPWTSVQLYDADTERARYYLDLFGADHMLPYTGTNRVEQIVARVTIAFFDRYVLHQSAALATMTQEGDVSGAAELVSGGEPVP